MDVVQYPGPEIRPYFFITFWQWMNTEYCGNINYWDEPVSLPKSVPIPHEIVRKE